MKYINQLFLCLFITLTIIGAFNWFVDPYGMYWSPVIERVNANKVESGTRTRVTKKHVISKVKPNIVFIGNSRIEMGINPGNPVIKNRAVYNYGIPGLSLQAQFQNAYNQLSHNDNLEIMLLSIDYLDFLYNEVTLAQPLPPEAQVFSINSSDSLESLKEQLPLVLSLDSTISSVRTVYGQNAIKSSITRLGYNDAKSFISTMQFEGKRPLFKQKLEQLIARLDGKGFRHKSPKWKTLDSNIQALQNLLQLADQKGVDLKLFINPYHYSYLHLLSDMGYWHDFKDWKKTLATSLEKDDIYDFSILSNYTLEQVELNRPHQQMKWFWEPAHYKSELGDLMLAVMLSDADNAGLAAYINARTIDGILGNDDKELLASTEQWKMLKAQLNITMTR